tara:strand:- start:397 stop:549 length:153 start_codon:yes stop_codon:yes gene_type:complete
VHGKNGVHAVLNAMEANKNAHDPLKHHLLEVAYVKGNYPKKGFVILIHVQ